MRRTRNAAIGATFLAALVAAAYLVVLIFNQDLTSTEKITVKASRAGLMMDPGAAVQMRGVQVGRVTSVSPTSDGAQLTLAIDPDEMKMIPADVSASIVPPTAFGAKYVDLQPVSSAPVTTPIKADAVLSGPQVTVEINQAFEHLMQTLQAAQPASVNAALNAVAGALDGRGQQLGQLIDQLDDYLTQLNPSMPELGTDISRSASVLKTYASLAPDLLSIASNVSTTSRTLTSQQKTLDALLVSFGSTADTTKNLLQTNGAALTQAVNLTDPITGLLAQYSPALTCTIEGLAYSNTDPDIDSAMGGTQGGIATTTELYPAQKPYTYPANLPVIGADNPSACYGLPVVPKSEILAPHIVSNTGANPYVDATTTTLPGLENTLFGTLMGLPGL